MAQLIIEGDPGQLRMLLNELTYHNYLPSELNVSLCEESTFFALLEACKAVLKRWYADDSFGAGTSEDGEIARMLQQAITKAEEK